VLSWLRRRKAATPDPWTIARTMEDGRTVLLRFRSFTPPGIDTADYPHLINIYWRFGGEANEGMPPAPLHDRMALLEQRLDAIEGAGTGFLVLAITGNNRKEWVWYVADTAAYMARVNEVLQADERFPVEFESAADPEWAHFRSLLGAVGEPRH
jgi:Family of unknown function (DUF695)